VFHKVFQCIEDYRSNAPTVQKVHASVSDFARAPYSPLAKLANLC